MRVLPNVHEALRQHDPSKAPASQPILPKKPLQQQAEVGQLRSTQTVNLQGLVRVQPAPPPKLPGSTPMTPTYPPRPPISALPQPCPDSANPATLKHPLPQPLQQGPPNKQVRHKPFRKSSRLPLRLLAHHPQQLICRG